MLETKTQCLLKKDNWQTVRWLSQKEITIGQAVKIKDEIWLIAEIYETVSPTKLQIQEKIQREYERLMYD